MYKDLKRTCTIVLLIVVWRRSHCRCRRGLFNFSFTLSVWHGWVSMQSRGRFDQIQFMQVMMKLVTFQTFLIVNNKAVFPHGSRALALGHQQKMMLRPDTGYNK